MASSKKVYNVGIIGYGLSTKVFHIPFIDLIPQLRLHSIVQRSPSPSSSAPADHPTISHHTSHEPMLADPDVDLVVIATPPNTHFAFASAALAAGKHVLCEKPFVPSSAEASELSNLAATKPGLVLCVYQNRRWDSDFLTVRKLLAEGTLGRVFEFETHFDRYRLAPPSGGWKANLEMDNGGGPLFDLGSHLIDQAVVLFGAPERVWGRLASQRGEAKGWDSVTAHLLYGRGLEVIVRIGIASCEARQLRFWVRGTKGSFKKWGLDSMEDQLRHAGYKGTEPDFGHEDKIYEGRLCTATEAGEIGEEMPYPNVEPVTYKGIYEGIVKAIESGKPEDVPVPADQAATVLRIIEAIRESAETGREVEVKKA